MNMKRIFLAGLAGVFTAAGAFAQTAPFTINGDVTQLSQPVEWVYLSYVADGQRITDSAKVVQGKYSFKGNTAEALQAGLRARYHEAPGTKGLFNRKRDYATFFLQAGNIGVASADSFANITVTGSKADME